MSLANVFIIVMLSYYSMYIVRLIGTKRRQAIKQTNKYLDNLRKIPVKSIEEQKRFLDVKYPKRGKFKFSWKMIPPVLLYMVGFIVIFNSYLYMFRLFNINIKFWQAIIVVVVLPILINLLLEKFGLEMDTIKSYVRWKK